LAFFSAILAIVGEGTTKGKALRAYAKRLVSEHDEGCWPLSGDWLRMAGLFMMRRTCMNGVRRIGLLSALVIVTLAGCGGHHGYQRDGSAAVERGAKQMNELIDQSVKDPNKASRVKALAKEIVDEAKQSHDQRRDAHRKLYELNGNYTAPPEEFTKILDEINNAHMRSATKILGLRFKIKEQVTPEEWRTLTEGMKQYGDRYVGESVHH
jgi:hypothetical protein